MSEQKDLERSAFEDFIIPSWSLEKRTDSDGDTVYVEDWVQGAWIGWQKARASLPQMYDELMAKNAALEGECERLTDELAAERDALAAELPALKAQQAGQELDELRRACAEILGQDPEAWPSHGNAPLAIASALALAVSAAPQPSPAGSAP